MSDINKAQMTVLTSIEKKVDLLIKTTAYQEERIAMLETQVKTLTILERPAAGRGIAVAPIVQPRTIGAPGVGLGRGRDRGLPVIPQAQPITPAVSPMSTPASSPVAGTSGAESLEIFKGI